MAVPYDWPAEALELLQELCKKGYSASQIAAKLKEQFQTTVTRNMVIGKVHRLRISGKLPIKLTPPKAYRPRPAIARVPRERAPWLGTIKIKPVPRYKPLGTCQYFIGDVICGKNSQGSWCDEHDKIVHVQQQSFTSQG